MRFIASAVAALFYLISVTDAQAQYSLCNKTSYALKAAMGYIDGERLATRGWWRLRPGECKIALSESTKEGSYWVYGESIAGHRGPIRSWSGDTPLCVETQGFFNLRNQEACDDDPTRKRDFFDVQVTSAANGRWQTDFVEAAFYTSATAKIAGMQRLLQDVGEKLEGTSDLATERVVAKYKRDRSLPAAATDEEVIDRLIEEATKREEGLGLFFCNKTESPIWTAYALSREESEIYGVRGWWKLAGGECARVIKGEIERDHVYVHAAVDGAGEDRTILGGDKKFCINTVEFDIEDGSNCADQEVEEASFRRFAIEAGAATITFEPGMFPPAPARP